MIIIIINIACIIFIIITNIYQLIYNTIKYFDKKKYDENKGKEYRGIEIIKRNHKSNH